MGKKTEQEKDAAAQERLVLHADKRAQERELRAGAAELGEFFSLFRESKQLLLASSLYSNEF